jgi:hypothetical protein
MLDRRLSLDRRLLGHLQRLPVHLPCQWQGAAAQEHTEGL